MIIWILPPSICIAAISPGRITPIPEKWLSHFKIIDSFILESVVQSGCAEEGAASEGVVEGVEDDGGENCKAKVSVRGIPS